MKHTFTKMVSIISIALFLIACEKSAVKSDAKNGKDLLSYAPKNTSYVFYANIDAVKSSAILADEMNEEFYKSQKSHKDFERLMKMTGFDPRKDVSEVLVAGNGIDETGSMLITVKGSFDSEKIVQYAKDEKEKHDKENSGEIVTEEYKGQKVYHFVQSEKSKETHSMKDPYVSFIDNKIMVAGSKDLVYAALDGKNGIASGSEMMKRIESIYGNDIYSTADVSKFKESVKIPAQVKDKVELIEQVSFGVTANETLSFSLIASCISEENANNLNDVAKGLIALARVGLSAERDLIDFMNEIEVKKEKKSINVSLEVTKDRLKKLKNYKDKLPLKSI